MNILYIVPYAPNPIRVRPYNLVRALARRGHCITLATLWSSRAEQTSLSRFTEAGITVVAAPLWRARSLWNAARTLPRPTPLQATWCWSEELFRSAYEVVHNGEVDVVHVEHLRGARYGTHLQEVLKAEGRDHRLGRGRRPAILWDSVDCISYLFEQAAHRSKSPFGRLVTRFELPRTRRHEAWLARQFDRTLVTSDLDRRAFCGLLQAYGAASNGRRADAANVRVVPNGVDLEYFRPGGGPREPQTIVFSGKMSYHANVTAALYLVNEIMPRVWDEFPNARVEIVGQNPPGQVKALERAHPGRVRVTGAVEDVRPYLGRAALAAAPITYGAGIQNKVLEAMAMGTPVVATPLAVSALSAENEKQVLLGDSAESFARQVMRLLRNRGLGERLGASGREYVEARHDWNRIAQQLEGIYEEAARELAPSAGPRPESGGGQIETCQQGTGL